MCFKNRDPKTPNAFQYTYQRIYIYTNILYKYIYIYIHQDSSYPRGFGLGVQNFDPSHSPVTYMSPVPAHLIAMSCSVKPSSLQLRWLSGTSSIDLIVCWQRTTVSDSSIYMTIYRYILYIYIMYIRCIYIFSFLFVHS